MDVFRFIGICILERISTSQNISTGQIKDIYICYILQQYINPRTKLFPIIGLHLFIALLSFCRIYDILFEIRDEKRDKLFWYQDCIIRA